MSSTLRNFQTKYELDLVKQSHAIILNNHFTILNLLINVKFKKFQIVTGRENKLLNKNEKPNPGKDEKLSNQRRRRTNIELKIASILQREEKQKEQIRTKLDQYFGTAK